MAEGNDETVFKDLNADDAQQGTTVIESCCMNCYKNVSCIFFDQSHSESRFESK